MGLFYFFFSSRRRHTRLTCDWSSDVCSSDLTVARDGSGILSNEDAIKQYKDTGEHLGIFNTPEEADRYGEMLHNSQADIYTKPSTVSIDDIPHHDRSEERRVGKECRSRWSPD